MPVAAPAAPLSQTRRLVPAPTLGRVDVDRALSLDLGRWNTPATPEEQELLRTLQGPVIDLGCGPGRLVLDLAARGVEALGVDSSSDAVRLARRGGAAVLKRDLFAPLPDEGRWATALLFDGNVGIGGDPVRLLARCRTLISPMGRIVTEVAPMGTGLRRMSARLQHDGWRSAPVEWALVGADVIAELAASARLTVATMTETSSGRWFAHLERTS